VLCQTPPVSLINIVLVAEVGGDLGSLNENYESIAALTANQKLLIDAELETCKEGVI
jgi:hypothetical protein